MKLQQNNYNLQGHNNVLLDDNWEYDMTDSH